MRKFLELLRGLAHDRWAIIAACVVLAVAALALGGYIVGWYANRARVERDTRRYQAMYVPDYTEPPTPSPAPTPSPTPDGNFLTDAPEESPIVTGAPSDRLEENPIAVDVPLDMLSENPIAVDVPLDRPNENPIAVDVPLDRPNENPVAVDVPIPTPNADTLIVPLPTPPKPQKAFGELLSHNPDTVAFLSIDELMSLPVVQRIDDNDFYLTHNFDGIVADEGTLFMDGVNRLVPEDQCLIVYGHNMKNGTMFAPLAQYTSFDFVKAHPVANFDTLYENRRYVPFSAFIASMNPEDDHYFDLRNFIFDESSFELFAARLKSHSAWRSPVDVHYGDRLLLLVTCEYTRTEGRFLLALRQLRPDEDATTIFEEKLKIDN